MRVPENARNRAALVASECIVFALMRDFLEIQDFSFPPKVYNDLDELVSSSLAEVEQIEQEYPDLELTTEWFDPVDTFKEHADLEHYFGNTDNIDMIQFYAFVDSYLRDDTVVVTSDEVFIGRE